MGAFGRHVFRCGANTAGSRDLGIARGDSGLDNRVESDSGQMAAGSTVGPHRGCRRVRNPCSYPSLQKLRYQGPAVRRD